MELTQVAVDARVQLVGQLGVMRPGIDVARTGASSVATSVHGSWSCVDRTLLGIMNHTFTVVTRAKLGGTHGCGLVGIGSPFQLGTHHGVVTVPSRGVVTGASRSRAKGDPRLHGVGNLRVLMDVGTIVAGGVDVRGIWVPWVSALINFGQQDRVRTWTHCASGHG